MPGFCPASFTRKFHFYQLEANIVKVLSWTWVDQRAVGDRARCGRFGAEVLLLNSLMNTSFWQISEGSKFPTTGSKGADHEDTTNNCSHRHILSTFHTCDLLIYTTQPHRRTIFSSGVIQGQGCGAHCSCLIYRSLGCVCSSRAPAICRSILDLVLTVDEMLFSDSGFKPWRDRSKIIPHTVSVYYA